MKTKLTVLALSAFFVSAALLAGCGGVPGNAVAEVEGTTIEKQDFEHWLTVFAKSNGQASGQASTSVPTPPDFKECIAAARKAAAKPAEGQPKQTDADFKKQCAEQYKQLRETTVGFLISYEWIEGEAEQQGVKVTDAEVKKSFEEQKKQNFPKAADYAKFLKDSGQSEADVLKRVRLQLVSNKITEKVTKGKDKVSAEQVETFYNANKAQFSQPERRDLSIVLTRTKAKAERAKAALEAGGSFEQVATRFSIDDASKAQGGKLPAVAQGQQEKAFDDAIFKARKGRILGPIKTQFGWYVFRVDKVTKASQQTLEEAKPAIEQQLGAQNQQKALDAFISDFREEWREKTECREGYTTQDCKNGPKPTPTPTVDPAQTAPTAPEGQ